MTRYPLLEVCARLDGHTRQHELLHKYCRTINNWQGLLKQAEREGMAPLLRKHLLEAGAEIPQSVRRSLNLLYKRHEKLARIRLKVLEDVMQLFHQHQITPILIKGAALCITLYSDPALRPMRDMDILFHEDYVEKAQKLLQDEGYTQSTSQIPADHHHLPSLYKNIDGIEICFELHRGLYPNITPHYPEVVFDKLLKTAHKKALGKMEVYVFNHKETLHYLYQHGFHPPLTYEPYKLISAADIISYTEKYFNSIDWNEMQKKHPACRHAIPLMHHISPWNVDKIPSDFLPEQHRKPHQLVPAPYRGWPRNKLSVLQSGRAKCRLLRDTFLPSRWWVSVYYGTSGVTGYLKAILRQHTRQLYLFHRLYSQK